MPDLVITFTNPPDERPNSALAPPATTTSSCTASRLNVNAGRCPPRCSPKNGLLKSAPSTDTLLWMPRWPATVSSSPSGPCTIATLGVSNVRLMKLRPLFGRPVTAAASSGVAAADWVTFTTGCVASTVTAARVTAASGSRSATVSPTPSAIPVRFTSA